MLEDGHISVQILAFEGVGSHRLILDANQVIKPGLAQGKNGTFQLPGSGIGGRHGEMPGDIILQNGCGIPVKGLAASGQFKQPLVIL